ncbi:MAG: WD40 repeat domain-containing protein, partial [Candidatus Entotheonellia bacterium]
FSPDGKLMPGGGPDTTVRLWEVQTGTVLRTLAGNSNGGTWVAFSPATRLLLTLRPTAGKTPQ